MPGSPRASVFRGASFLPGSGSGFGHRPISSYFPQLVASRVPGASADPSINVSAAAPAGSEVLVSVEDDKMGDAEEEGVRALISVVIGSSVEQTLEFSPTRNRRLRPRSEKAKSPMGSRPIGITKHRKLDKDKTFVFIPRSKFRKEKDKVMSSGGRDTDAEEPDPFNLQYLWSEVGIPTPGCLRCVKQSYVCTKEGDRVCRRCAKNHAQCHQVCKSSHSWSFC